MLRIAVVFALLTVASLSGQSPARPTAPQPLPVTKVVLYKGGIGYFEHLTTVNGDQRLAVPFTSGQLDDVLKSLTAIDLGEGRVMGVTYESPTPIERRLQALRLSLGPSATAFEFMRALRGAQLEATTANGATVSGRLLSVERREAREGIDAARDELTLVNDRGDVTTVALGPGTRVRVVEAGLRQEVSQYLDVAASSRDGNARQMIIATAGQGARQLLVSYVGEAAVWKTTYRLVFPSGSRAPRLQGWAIVDNLSASDWQDVELSLVAGAPQSFVQALSAPLFSRRPVVPVAAGLNPTPQLHAAALIEGPPRLTGVVADASTAMLPGVTVSLIDAAGRTIRRAVTNADGEYTIPDPPAGVATVVAELPGFTTARRTGVVVRPGEAQQVNFQLLVGALSETITVTAEEPAIEQLQRGAGRDAGGGVAGGRIQPPRELIEQRVLELGQTAQAAALGELFEYKLADRVSIRRNESALVPILQADVDAERVSVWSQSTGPQPRRAVWLTNATSLTLDAGSLSVVDAGAFAGEGLVDTVKPGDRRLVSYAVDQAVQVDVKPGPGTGRLRRLRIADGVMVRETEDRDQRVYTIRNADRDARTVLLEHPALAGWTLASVVPPAESTATVHRFRQVVPGGATSMLTVDALRPGTSQFSLVQFTPAQLAAVTDRADFRTAIEEALRPVIAARAEVARVQERETRRRTEETAITADQSRVRENMKALQRSAEERQLLARYTRQLDAQETRLEQLRAEREVTQRERTAADEKLRAAIQAVSLDLTP